MKLNRRLSYAVLAAVLATGGAVAYADHNAEHDEPAADAMPVAGVISVSVQKVPLLHSRKP